ncbi:uncharacterized protein [Hyperolius riggenbachi]|uniref:uncharacterized protein isoform X2 n=1 Tax=Hyperolius riggenbachi TaxID=752182 RepID=UPI0035A36F9E
MDLHTHPVLFAFLLALDISVGLSPTENQPRSTQEIPLQTTDRPNYGENSPVLLSSALLYPYGSSIDSLSPKIDDGGTELIRLSRVIPLFGTEYSSLYVNNNGLLSFQSPISQYVPQALPVAYGNPFLAIFWADVDNRYQGDIYYRESTDPDLLYRATSDVRLYFRDPHFLAQWVFVATWHRVGYFASNTDKVNTFQVVLSTDGNQTFLLYNYEDIQWPSLDENGYIVYGPVALAGLNSGYDTGYYTIPKSLSPAIANISSTSNVNVTGRWVFKASNLHPEDPHGDIDQSSDNPEGPQETTVPPPVTLFTTTAAPLISSALIYPYGSSIDSLSPKIDDGGTELIRLSRVIPLFGTEYSSLYVNNNGLLSFQSPISQYVPQALPVAYGNPFLAIFWADVDNRYQGDIYYRESTDPDLLYRATSDVRLYFRDPHFLAQWVFVATWHRVGYFASNTDKVNTFQVVLSTDGNQTFLLYNYEDIQWPSLDANGYIVYGPVALAGLNSGLVTGYYTIPESLSPAIANISSTSNVNVTGRWVFKASNLHPEDPHGDIDQSSDNPEDPPETTVPPPVTLFTTTTAAPLISSALLYPYGSSIDSLSPKIDDGGTELIRLSRVIPLFGTAYSSLYVNNNGLLSFQSPIGQYVPQALPVAFGNPFLAIFWADVDNRYQGDIYYRESTDPDLLYRATSDVRLYFRDPHFLAQWVFVATWHRVGYYASNTDKLNTFQVVLSTDGNQTFLLYNYEDIQWPSLDANGYIVYGPVALAGLNSGNDTGYYAIPESLSPAIANISSTSNVNVTGRWVFKASNLHPEDVHGDIDQSSDNQDTTVPPPVTLFTTTSAAPLISSALLYPYGSSIDSLSPKIDDGGTELIRLSRVIPLFGTEYSSLYVNNNGLLSFQSPISQYVPQALPVAYGNPFLAIFWADVDNRYQGDIYYRESTDPDLLYRATSDVRLYFRDPHFLAQWVFVATWHRVGYFASNTDKVNTFQVVLSTDGNQTFLLYNYEDIQWPTLDANGYIVYGPVALAGLNSGLVTGYYTIPESLSPAIANISSTSNVNVTGRWVFKASNLHPEDPHGDIDQSSDNPEGPQNTTVPPPITLFTTTTAAPLISSALLYPYGSSIDSLSPKIDDGGTELIRLSRVIPLFGTEYSSLYVNNNGLLSFQSPIRQYVPQALPVAYGNPFLAIFWADVDNRYQGDIYYRESTDPDLLYRATSDVRLYFRDPHFLAQWVFVATWHRVGYYASYTDKVNTFQVVLSTDGNQTFLLYNYEDIQWPSLDANGYIVYGPVALAGLNSGLVTGHYTIPESLSPAIANISSTSNVNVTGRWAFKASNLHPEDPHGDQSSDNQDTTVPPPVTLFTTTTAAPLISSALLYPYGSSIDSLSPKIDDGGTELIRLSRVIPLFGTEYSSLYVNNNGLLSFQSPIGQYVPQALPVAFGNPFLAIFWADVDNRYQGDIYYRESTDPDLLYRATSDVRLYFRDPHFLAQWVFVATWHRVGYFASNTDKVNTFQVVLSTDGNQTFLLYNYEDIQWPSLDANGYIVYGPVALAGLNSGNDTGYYTIPKSLSPAIANISSTSNVNVTGRWVFKASNLHPEDPHGGIDNPEDPQVVPPPVTLFTTTTTAAPLISSVSVNVTSQDMASTVTTAMNTTSRPASPASVTVTSQDASATSRTLINTSSQQASSGVSFKDTVTTSSQSTTTLNHSSILTESVVTSRETQPQQTSPPSRASKLLATEALLFYFLVIKLLI